MFSYNGLYFIFQALTSVAYDFYDRVIVMTLDAKEYIWWSSKFVPANYGRLKVCKLFLRSLFCHGDFILYSFRCYHLPYLL